MALVGSSTDTDLEWGLLVIILGFGERARPGEVPSCLALVMLPLRAWKKLVRVGSIQGPFCLLEKTSYKVVLPLLLI